METVYNITWAMTRNLLMFMGDIYYSGSRSINKNYIDISVGRGPLIVRVLNSWLSRPCLNPGCGHCAVLVTKKINSKCLSITRCQLGTTSQFYAVGREGEGSLTMDQHPIWIGCLSIIGEPRSVTSWNSTKRTFKMVFFNHLVQLEVQTTSTDCLVL